MRILQSYYQFSSPTHKQNTKLFTKSTFQHFHQTVDQMAQFLSKLVEIREAKRIPRMGDDSKYIWILR